MDRTEQFEREGDEAAAQGRDIQAPIDAKEAKDFGGGKEPKAMQAGAREYPVPPFPKQHQKKPGEEYRLDPAPMYDAPFWKGSGKLEGFAALITGADSGIGRAVAVLFAREGADIVICHLDEDRDAEETKAAVEAEGRRAIILAGDVADPAFAKMAVDETIKAFGRLDVLVNNAAFQQHVQDFADITVEQFDRTLKTNLYGYFHMAQAAVPHMKPGGAIVMTGSVTGIMGNDKLLDYSLTKGGIHAFARSLGTHLTPKGIRVNVVAPEPNWLTPSGSRSAGFSGVQTGPGATTLTRMPLGVRWVPRERAKAWMPRLVSE